MTRRLVTLGLLLACTVALVAAAGRPEADPPRAATLQEVEVLGLVLTGEPPQPMVVLRGKQDRRTFAMAIGPAEAAGIALPLGNVRPPRPLTHDLFLTLFGRLGVSLVKVVITDLRADVYYATVHLQSGGRAVALDSRPSDAIALALRAHAPVYAEDRVFDKSERPAAPAAPRI